MGSCTQAEGGLVTDLRSRRGDGRCGEKGENGGVEGVRVKGPEGIRRERAKGGYSGRGGRWTWALRLLLRVWALYLVQKFSCMSRFGSLKCPKVMELSAIKRTSGSFTPRSHN